MSICTACKAELPEYARFCSSCGKPVGPGSDERRIATILFGDIAGFTTMSETMDPEQVKNLVDGCLERLAGVVERYGGTVDKIVGDAIVALFGAPVAHEDDAERAVRAGLEMQEEVRRFAAEAGTNIEFKVGVNTGEVVVGGLRAGQGYTSMGDATNVAARLEASAAPGEVLVGPLTWATTNSAIDYEDRGALTVKGRREPVEVWLARRPITSPGEKHRSARTGFVGRESEMALITGFLERLVERGRAGLCMIAGDPGVGKSRLAREVAVWAEGRYGAVSLEGRCPPYGETSVWSPLSSVLRKACGIGVSDSPSEVARKCRQSVSSAAGNGMPPSEIDRVSAAVLSLVGIGDPGGRGSLPATDVISAVRSFLVAKAAEAPLIITLSDLQWADRVLVEFVSELVAKAREVPLLVLALGREEIGELWPPAALPKNLLSVSLEPLDRRAASELITDLLQARAPDDLIEFLLTHCEGNPFYIEEMVGFLIQVGAVRVDDGEVIYSLDSSAQEVPASLGALEAARVDSLNESERAVLQDASVIGRRGRISLLAEVARRRGMDSVDGMTDALEAKGLLSIHGSEYEIRSELARGVAYARLTKADRARRHMLVAEASMHLVAPETSVESGIGKLRGNEAESIAFHLREAAQLVSEVGNVDGVPGDIASIAIRATMEASEDAEERDWPADAERLYSGALALIGTADVEMRIRAVLGLARAQLALHASDRARPNVDIALELASRSGDGRSMAEAQTVAARLAQIEGDFDEAESLFAEAVSGWVQSGDRRGEAMARRSWAEALILAGRYKKALTQLETALELFEATDDIRGRAWALQNLAWTNFLMGDTDASDEYASASLEAFGDLGDTGGLGWALGMLAWTRFGQGRRNEAEALARSILDQIGPRRDEQAWAAGIMEVLLSMIELSFGRVSAALDLSESAYRTMQQLNDTWGRCRAQAPKILSLCWLGRLGEMRDAIEALDALAADLPDPREQAFVHAIAAAGCLYAGWGEEAASHGWAAIKLLGADSRLLGSDLSLAVGGGLLMKGMAPEAAQILEKAISEYGTSNQSDPALLSLAMSSVGAYSRALEYAEIALGIDGWFHSTVLANLARAVALRGANRDDEARSAIERAVAVVEATDSDLAKAITALARGVITEELGDPAAGSAIEDARERLRLMGATPESWERVFRGSGSKGAA